MLLNTPRRKMTCQATKRTKLTAASEMLATTVVSDQSSSAEPASCRPMTKKETAPSKAPLPAKSIEPSALHPRVEIEGSPGVSGQAHTSASDVAVLNGTLKVY